MCIQTLATAVKERYGKQTILPSDCKQLSGQIAKDTGFLLSETTLKRVFGYAQKKYAFSNYTLEGLALYCGFTSFTHFSELTESKTSNTYIFDSNTDMDNPYVSDSAKTLTWVKNLSGISFTDTIERKKLSTHFTRFLSSKKNIAALVGPAGSGKSIALAKFLLSQCEEESFTNDTCHFVYLNANKIDQLLTANWDFKEWLISKNSERKKVLIIDGFDERNLPLDRLVSLTKIIINITSINKSSSGIKIILATRPSVFGKITKQLERKNAICNPDASDFFFTFMHQELLFDPNEIQELLVAKKRLKDDIQAASESFKQFIAYPSYFEQVYNMWHSKGNFNEEIFAMRIVYKQVNLLFANLQVRHTEVSQAEGLVKRSDGLDMKTVADNLNNYSSLMDFYFIRPDSSLKNAKINFSSSYLEEYFNILFTIIPKCNGSIVELMNAFYYNTALYERKKQILKWVILQSLYSHHINLWNLSGTLETASWDKKEKEDIMFFMEELVYENPELSSSISEIANVLFKEDSLT